MTPESSLTLLSNCRQVKSRLMSSMQSRACVGAATTNP